jgi:HEAT repeat protein
LSLVKIDPGPQILAALLKSLETSGVPERQSILFALGQMGPTAKDATPRLLELTEDRNGAVRITAALNLYKISGLSDLALPVLRAALKEADDTLRLDAAIFLWQVDQQEGERTALPILLAGLKEKRSRFRALTDLHWLGPKAKAIVPTLLEMLREASTRDAFFLKRTLKAIDPAALMTTEH